MPRQHLRQSSRDPPVRAGIAPVSTSCTAKRLSAAPSRSSIQSVLPLAASTSAAPIRTCPPAWRILPCTRQSAPSRSPRSRRPIRSNTRFRPQPASRPRAPVDRVSGARSPPRDSRMPDLRRDCRTAVPRPGRPRPSAKVSDLIGRMGGHPTSSWTARRTTPAPVSRSA